MSALAKSALGEFLHGEQMQAVGGKGLANPSAQTLLIVPGTHDQRTWMQL